MKAPDPETLLAELDRECLPHLSVNAVIFGAHDGALKVLLMESAGTGTWSLPGGYVRRTESMDDAVSRVLFEMTALSGTTLRQFHTFGGAARGEAAVASALHAHGIDVPADHWVLGRVVSVGYVALVDVSQARVAPSIWANSLRWWDLTDRPSLIIDHDDMVQRALKSARSQIDDLLVETNLLPPTFTMPELQRLHETILGRSLDRRNFQKRMLELGLVERLPDLRQGVRRKPAFTYRWARRDGGSA